MRAPALAALLVAPLACGAASAAAPSRPHVTLQVRVDPDARTARGHVKAEIENASDEPLDHLELWRYPARLETRSPALDSHNFYWEYPDYFDWGAMSISAVTVEGLSARPVYRDHAIAGEGTLVDVPLPEAIRPGARVTLEADFVTRIPDRFNTFGCHHGVCTLSGGFYPMPVQLGLTGYDESAPPARADIDVTVEFDEARDLPDCLIDGVRRQTAHLEDSAWAQLSIAPRYRDRGYTRGGARVTFHHLASHFLDGDRPARLLADVKEAQTMLDELQLPLPDSTTLDLVEAPLRMEVATPESGAVLVSDEIYRIFPIQRFRKFHSFQLVRAVYGALVERMLAESERPDDLAFSPDVVASWLVDLYTLRAYRSKEFAKDILRWVSFVPAVDRILYAPQVPFATAYFNTLDEPDPTRDDLRRFDNQKPRGKLVYEKLRDLLGDAKLAQAMRMVWFGAPLREATERVYGGSLDWFYQQWLGSYPQVDYRFELEGGDRTPDGRSYALRVYKAGPSPPVERVELRVTEWGGAERLYEWDGRGASHTFFLHTKRAIRSVVLDPRGRLVQRTDGDNDDLRVDDRDPAKVKFIYNNLGALFNFGTLSLDLSLDFSFIRLYDLKNIFRLAFYHDEATLIGALFGYYRNLGAKITPARLTSALYTLVRGARLDPTFAQHGEPALHGDRFSLLVGYSYDDRPFLWEYWNGLFGGVTASYVLTLLDSGDHFQQGTVTANVGGSISIVPGHSVALAASAAATFGDLQVPSQALFAGGPNGLRGYLPDELPGRAYALVRGEYRHLFAHDLDFNLFWLGNVRGFAGAAFVEAAAVTPCDALYFHSVNSATDPAHDLAHNIYVDAGYSFQILADLLGVSQTRFNVDVAVPLVHRARSCLGSPPFDDRGHLPIGLAIYFGPQW